MTETEKKDKESKKENRDEVGKAPQAIQAESEFISKGYDAASKVRPKSRFL